jgi:hypothetical protein
MRKAPHRTCAHRRLLLAAAFPAVLAAANAAEPAADPCARYTLEKVLLGMTKPEVEALNLGKIETAGQTSEQATLRVKRSKHTEEINIVLHHGRVALVAVSEYVNASGSADLLADLRARWGEPDKGENSFGAGKIDAYKLYNWSSRDCQSYGALFYNSGYAIILLSTSPSVTHPRDPAKDFPALAR